VTPVTPRSDPRCRHCRSGRVRRSSAHGRLERWIRRATPIHFYSCGDCGRRSWLWRPGAGKREEQPAVAARRVERRDLRMRMRERRQFLWMVLVALALGTATGLSIQRCGSTAATAGDRG